MIGKTITAIIPSSERPARYLTTSSGEAPCMLHTVPEGERRTAEGVLHLIGRQAANITLNVDRYLTNGTYQTDPIKPLEPMPGYTWSTERPLV